MKTNWTFALAAIAFLLGSTAVSPATAASIAPSSRQAQSRQVDSYRAKQGFWHGTRGGDIYRALTKRNR